jgi:MFS family permease
MATSLLPTFLTSTLNAGPAALGAVEGIADALIGVSKLAGGPLASDPARRSRLASGGYLGTAVATAAIGLTTAAWQVGFLRAAAWVSRGLRGPAKDTILTTLAPRSAYGRAFGLERSADNAGAIVGPLMAAAIVGLIGIRNTILLALVPGLLAAVSITVAAREAVRSATPAPRRAAISLELGRLRAHGLARTMIPIVVFELGNLATTLLILRATGLLTGDQRSLTQATSVAILLYAAHNATASVASLGGGRLVDRLSPRLVFGAGAACYVLAYLCFAVGSAQWPWLLVGFLLAGVGIGFAETAESTMVALTLPEDLRANGFGVLGLVQSFGDLGATLVAGALWALFSPAVAFGYAATWMALALVAVGPSSRPRRP